MLVQSLDQKKKDTTIYVYKKRDDLDFMMQKTDSVHKISSNITHFFNNKLFVGRYQNIRENKKVYFKTNGALIGFEKYDTYQVRNYFGTLHPHKNLDVITFFNSANETSKQCNWKFKDGQEYSLNL